MPTLFDPTADRYSGTGEGGLPYDLEEARGEFTEFIAPEPSAAADASKPHVNFFTGEATDDPLKADFRLFLAVVWEWLGLPKPTPIQLDIAYWLQHGPDRSVIMGFRGVAKSWITAAFALWVLYCDPQKKVLVVSASLRRAVNFVTFCLQIIRECPHLKHLEPDLKQRQSAQAFDVKPARPDQNPSLYAAGITGQLNGPRADVIVPDDVETSSNSLTVLMRDKIKDAIREFDAIIKPNGIIKYLGTPQTEDSIYNALPARGYTIRIWPSEYPIKDNLRYYGDRLAPMVAEGLSKDPRLAGHSTEPTRFTDEDLAKRKLSWGASGYALQYLLITTIADANRFPLKLRNLITMGLDPLTGPEIVSWGNAEALIHKSLPNLGMEGDHFYGPANVSQVFGKYTERVAGLDPSGRGNDETAMSITAELHATVFWLYSEGWTDGYAPETLRAICKACVDFRVQTLRIETNFGDGMFAALLRPYMDDAWAEANKGNAKEDIGATLIVEVTSGKAQKEKRIISIMEPLTQQHRLVVNTEIIEKDFYGIQQRDGEETRHRYSAIYQFTHLTHERDCLGHDDRIESLAIACSHFASKLGINPLALAERAQEDREAEEIERLFADADEIGGVAHSPSSNRIRASMPQRRH